MRLMAAAKEAKLAEGTRPTDTEIESFYTENKDLFEQQQRIQQNIMEQQRQLHEQLANQQKQMFEQQKILHQNLNNIHSNVQNTLRNVFANLPQYNNNNFNPYGWR